MKLAALCCLLVLSSTVATAKQDEPVIPSARLSPAAVGEVAAEIRSGMREGGRFQWVSKSERMAVERDLDIMVNTLSGLDSVDQLKPPQRVELFNAQARTNEILGLRDGNRLVCERRRRTGSKLIETHCESYAERMDRQRSDRKVVEDFVDSRNPESRIARGGQPAVDARGSYDD